MEARHRPLLFGAGAAVVAIVAAAVVMRGSPKAIEPEADAGHHSAAASPSTAASSSAATSSSVAVAGSASPEPMASRATTASAAPSASAAAHEGGAADATTASAPAADTAVARPAMVRVDESNDGKSVEIAPGQQLLATLDANPTTGFDWAVIRAPAALGAPAMGYVSSSSAMGAPGKRHLTWTVRSALPPGEHVLELGYARSFEKGVPPFKTFRLKVRAPR